MNDTFVKDELYFQFSTEIDTIGSVLQNMLELYVWWI